MKNLLYILLHFSSAVIANWITIEHDFHMCDLYHLIMWRFTFTMMQTILIPVEALKHEPPSSTYNITMWGCTYDCSFNFIVQINRNGHSISTPIDNNMNNYKCKLSNYTQNLVPTPKLHIWNPNLSQTMYF